MEALPVGIDETENQRILLYPNPAHNDITIEGMNCSKIELYDAFGKLILVKELVNFSQPVIHFDLEQVHSGIYFMKLFEADTDNFAVRKIIKQ